MREGIQAQICSSEACVAWERMTGRSACCSARQTPLGWLVRDGYWCSVWCDWDLAGGRGEAWRGCCTGALSTGPLVSATLTSPARRLRLWVPARVAELMRRHRASLPPAVGPRPGWGLGLSPAAAFSPSPVAPRRRHPPPFLPPFVPVSVCTALRASAWLGLRGCAGCMSCIFQAATHHYPSFQKHNTFHNYFSS